MTRKSSLLLALTASALIAAAAPAFAEGDHDGRDMHRQQGGRGNDGAGRSYERMQQAQPDRGGDRRGPGNGQGNGGNNNGNWRERAQAGPAPQQQQQQQQQRPNWSNGGRNDNGFQNRMREAQTQQQQQGRPDWANGRGADNQAGRVQPPAPQPAPRIENQNRFGQNGGQPNWRSDPRANRGPDNRYDGRTYTNNGPRGPQNYGGAGAYSRNNWASRNDWARYDRRPRTTVNIRIGGYFGPSYGTIASRFYGHNYIWYGARSWTSWNRPWRIGYVLPPAMYCEPLPYDLYFDLPPPPIGYDYILCDGDILIVGQDSGVVYDAILPW